MVKIWTAERIAIKYNRDAVDMRDEGFDKVANKEFVEFDDIKAVLEELKHWLFKEEKSFTIVIKRTSENGVVNHACGYKYAILNALKQIEQVEEKLGLKEKVASEKRG